MTENLTFAPSCPFPFDEYPHIVMAHGGGGRLMKRLLDELIIPVLSDNAVDEMHDAAVISPPNNQKLVMTTDSFVINPLEFAGGNIGCLSIYGTVNDLAMAGATPNYISVGLILEEGLPMQTLYRLLCSMRQAADRIGVKIVTGDTKVVDRGKGDGIYINTAGIGFVDPELHVHPRSIQTGDVLLVNGDIGRHGIAVMAQREGLRFETTIESDCMSLSESVQALIAAGVELHCLRDLTRGGLVSVLNELATSTGQQFVLQEEDIPVASQVESACELLGLDPLYVACEGRFLAVLPAEQADLACRILKEQHYQLEPYIIGTVNTPDKSPVVMQNRYGGMRVLDMLSGEQLPRIC